MSCTLTAPPRFPPQQHAAQTNMAGRCTGSTHLFPGSALLQVAFVVAGRELRAGSRRPRALPDGCSRHGVSLPGHRPRTKGRSVIRRSDTPSPMRQWRGNNPAAGCCSACCDRGGGSSRRGQCAVWSEWLFIISKNDVSELQGDIPGPLYFHTQTAKYVFV